MKLLFILPSVGRKPGSPYVKTWRMEPLSIAVLSAMTPRTIRKFFADDRLEEIPFDADVDAVALSVETYTALRAYRIAEKFRKRNVTVIMGGFHATLQSDEAALHADCVITGNAEGIWPSVCDDLCSGTLKARYAGTDATFHCALADRSIYAGKRYSPLALIETGRGCPFTCGFCSVSAFFRQRYTARPIGDVISEIKHRGARTVFFIDDNIAVDIERTCELFRAIETLGIRWCGQVSLEAARHPGLLKLMRSSGCMGVLVGFESLSDENLASMGKNVNRKQEGFSRATAAFRENGLALYGTFMFGYDHDTVESFEATYRFVCEQKFFFAAFNHLVPFPGTPLYDSLASRNRLLYPAWWLHDQCRFGEVVFNPAHFSPRELADTCLAYRRKFYSAGSIAARALDLKANCRSVPMGLLFFAQNIIARGDVQRRQGIIMGEGT